jgi:3-hydroxyacyl-CoA dehydrogenase
MFWADTEGLAKIVAGLEKHGFEVSALLREKAEKGEKLSRV